MSRVYRHWDTKKPATLLGRGLAVGTGTGCARLIASMLLQLHSLFVRCRLLLCQTVDITATQ